MPSLQISLVDGWASYRHCLCLSIDYKADRSGELWTRTLGKGSLWKSRAICIAEESSEVNPQSSSGLSRRRKRECCKGCAIKDTKADIRCFSTLWTGHFGRDNVSKEGHACGVLLLLAQVIAATPDGKGFDKEDAQLQLDQGIPRFYLMQIPRRGLKFDAITYHDKVTQCLGSLASEPWYMTVAAPSGSVDRYPKQDDLAAFEIPPNCFVKLHAGTWHAGPLFQEPEKVDFYNLELSDTNVVDHNTHHYKDDGIVFQLESG